MDSIFGCTLNFLLLVPFWPIKLIGLLITNFIYRGPNKPLPPIHDDFLKSSAVEVAAKIRNREITAEQVVRGCIKRIADINNITNCVAVDRFQEALQEAKKVDKELAEGTTPIEEILKSKPFWGVPFTTKNGIAIKGHPQTAGMLNRKEIIAAEDAAAVSLMRQAGAIPLATTNVPEMMMWWETNNKLYGRCKNPYHSQYIVGGSSGGEAAVLAAAGSFLGLGADLGGSIRLPSSMCGIFGHLPSRRVVSRAGHFSERVNASMGSLGPMSKSAKDLLPMLKVLTEDKIELRLDGNIDIKKLRYFYMDDNGGCPWVTGIDPVDTRVKDAVNKVVDYFYKTYGITIVKVNIEELKYGLEMWWSKRIRKNGELFSKKMNGGKFKTNIPLEFVKVMFGLSEHRFESPKYGSPKHTKFLKMAEKMERTLTDLLRDDGVFFYPTHPTPPIKHTQTILRGWNISYTSVFNASECPVTQCPITKTVEGLPIGIQVVASPFQDRLTIAVAEELEKAFGGWTPPPSQIKLHGRSKRTVCQSAATTRNRNCN